jgi:hypothetical protein
MRTQKDVEAYLDRTRRPYSHLDDQPGTYLVTAQGGLPTIAVRVDPPLVLVRAPVGDVPKDGHTHIELYRKLLISNAKTLVHGSFGLEDDKIVLCSALEIENLDYNELEATLDEIEMTLVQQVPQLLSLSKKD